MPIWHGNIHKRGNTGGKRRLYRGKRAFERGSPSVETTVGEKKIKISRQRGGIIKRKALLVQEANITDPSTQKTQKTQIKKLLENQANRDYQKRGIITKGAVIETALGKARVTSRPGQDGVVNAILLERDKK
ncbi:30S ribosomal protein S8e [[Eubacterium] cellulosolvens]